MQLLQSRQMQRQLVIATCRRCAKAILNVYVCDPMPVVCSHRRPRSPIPHRIVYRCVCVCVCVLVCGCRLCVWPLALGVPTPEYLLGPISGCTSLRCAAVHIRRWLPHAVVYLRLFIFPWYSSVSSMFDLYVRDGLFHACRCIHIVCCIVVVAHTAVSRPPQMGISP